MYDFLFNTKIGYFILLFTCSAALSGIVSAILYIFGMDKCGQFFLGAIAANFIASLFYAITKRVF